MKITAKEYENEGETASEAYVLTAKYLVRMIVFAILVVIGSEIIPLCTQTGNATNLVNLHFNT